jgi:hypothetical protein
MSSSGCESEPSLDSESSYSSNESIHLESGDEDVGVVNLVINPHENEPLANPADDEITCDQAFRGGKGEKRKA